MPRMATTLILCALAQLAAAGQDAEESDEARTDGRARALMESVEARLGRGRLRSVRATAKVSWQGMPGEGAQREVYAWPLLQGRAELDFPGFGRFEGGSDGAVVWERSPLGVQVREGWEASEVLRRHGRALHAPWTQLYAAARSAGEVELDGVACRRVELLPRLLVELDPRLPAPPAPEPDVLYVDAEAELPVRLETQAPGMDGARTTAEWRFADWRAVGEHRFPHRVELRVSGFVMQVDYERYELDVELPEGLFAPGEEVLAAREEQLAGGGPLRDDEIRLMTLTERPIASIRMKCRHADIQKTLAVLLPEALAHVLSSGAETAGHPLVRYHGSPENGEIDLEAAIPVRAPIEPGGRVKAEALPGGEAAVTWHVGPYEQLGSAYERLMTWMTEHGYEAAGACWEEYWTDPGLEPDPSKWRTRVVWPVRAKRPPEQGGGGDDER